MLSLPSPVRCHGRPELPSEEPCAYAGDISLSEQGAVRVAVQDVGGHVQSLGERELRIHQVQRRAEQRGGHFGGESEADWLLLERVWRVVEEANVVFKHVVKTSERCDHTRR